MAPAAKSPTVMKKVVAKKTPIKEKKTDLGAGLRVSKDNIEAHPAGPPRYGELTQAERAFTLASTFLSGVLAISASQFLGAPLKLIDPQFYDGYMAYTKECFAILVTCLTQWWAPTLVRVSGDSSMVGQLIKKPDGSLECRFAERMVLMANHQLYTDWLYLWWIAYTNKMHGFVYIILKESLKNIPIIGWSAQFYNFIFLSRKWEDDQRTFKKHLGKLNKVNDPMWLIIFPEGTNLSETTRERSKKWAEKNGLQDMKHQLLPRSTGLKFCLNELRETTEWLYDCTIAYEGVPPGQFGQDIFTLRSTFFEGRPPKSVNMHWRRFHLDDIPYENTKAFEVWLRNRWREKDYMLEYFNRNNRFPAEDFWRDHLEMDSQSSRNGNKSIRSVPKPAVQIETEVKSGSWNEFVKIFAPITSVMMALTVAYGASPADLPIPGGKEFFEQHMKTLLGQGGEMKGLPSPEQLEKMIEGAAQIGSKMGAAQATDAQELSGAQKLTQENLARLVKETAIQSGVVMPGGMRRASTALPQVPTKTLATATTTVPRKAKSAINPSRTPLGAASSKENKTGTSAHARANPIPSKSTPNKVNSKPAAAIASATGPMKEVTLASGVTIKVPSAPVEPAKPTSTVTLKNGLKIAIPKEDADKAHSKKGETIFTSSGIPIKVTPTGTLAVVPDASKTVSTIKTKTTSTPPPPLPLPLKKDTQTKTKTKSPVPAAKSANVASNQPKNQSKKGAVSAPIVSKSAANNTKVETKNTVDATRK